MNFCMYNLQKTQHVLVKIRELSPPDSGSMREGKFYEIPLEHSSPRGQLSREMNLQELYTSWEKGAALKQHPLDLLSH